MSRTVATAAPDVVVIGSGVAGLCAAIEAATRGARVLVCEGAPAVGGASVMSGAGCCLVGTPLQESLGVQDSVELALSDLVSFGGPTADEQWARAYLAASRSEVHDWCESLGIRWTSLVLQEGNSVARWHGPQGWGRAIVAALLSRCDELGVEIAVDSPVTDIEVESGAVRTVTVDTGGSVRVLRVNAVVVCSGGFVANHEMVLGTATGLRSVDRLLCGGSPLAVGAGHALLQRVGAEFVNLDHIWVYPNGTPDPQDPLGLRGLGVRGVTGDIWLNQEGRRFHDETRRGGHSGTSALLKQPGQTAWCVFTAAEFDDVLLIDNEYYATPAGSNPVAMQEFWRESPFAWRADTPVALAAAIGLPAEAVQQSIEQVDACIAKGLAVEGAFGRDLRDVRPFMGPGLVALQFFPMAQKNFGGVHTDIACRVLRAEGDPIHGLYAAGEVAGMAGGALNGRAALEGTMFGPCLYSGRVAGATAGAGLSAPGQPAPGLQASAARH